MFARLIALAGAMVMLVSCASAPPQTGAARLGLRLSPASLGESVALQQHLTIARNGRTDELDAALEVDATQLHLVGLALGQRVVSLDYDGTRLTTWRHVMLPSQVRAEDILEDLQLTLWPAAAIAAALPDGWRIEEQGLTRSLYLRDELICVIHYSDGLRWHGMVELENFRYHYKINILNAADNS